ncbi:TetR/AcrR family transcriptional regulator [Nitratifractor sp.]
MEKEKSTKEKILETAVELFSRQGYMETSLEQIAERCGITKPAIYYHFRDKAALYREVTCGQFATLAERIEERTRSGRAGERLEAYVQTFGEFLLSDPAFSAIFSREIASGGATLAEGCLRDLARTLQQLTEILEQGVAEGAFTPEPPFLVQMMIVTPLCAYHTSRPLRERVVGLLEEGEEIPEVDFHDVIERISEKIIKAVRC